MITIIDKNNNDEELKKSLSFNDRMKRDALKAEIRDLFNKNQRLCIEKASKYLKVLEKDGKTDTTVLFIRALCYRNINNVRAEIDDLKEILKVEPNNTDAIYELFAAYYNNKEFGDAQHYLSLLLSCDRKLLEKHNLTSLYRAKRFIASMNIDQKENTNRVINRISKHKEVVEFEPTVTINCKYSDGTIYTIADEKDEDYLFGIEDMDDMRDISIDVLDTIYDDSDDEEPEHFYDHYYSVEDEENFNRGIIKPQTKYFFENINIKYLYDCVKRSLIDAKPSKSTLPYTVYYFGVSKIGYSENEIYNSIVVLVVPTTGQIYDIFPTYVIRQKNYNILECDYKQLRGGEQKVYSK